MTEGVESVRALARSGREAPTVRAAASREHHKEPCIGAVIDGQLVDGYMDLLYRADDGPARHRPQDRRRPHPPETVRACQAHLALYARATSESTWDPVSRCVLVFCREDGADERGVPLG